MTNFVLDAPSALAPPLTTPTKRVRRRRYGKTCVVTVSDMVVSSDPEEVIVTFGLGSCLGITAYDPVQCVGGMLHAMLPEACSYMSPDGADPEPFMFVDTGIEALLDAMVARGAERSRLIIKVAGGAFMKLSSGPESLYAIGKRNFLTLRALLRRHGLELAARDVGGTRPRTMQLSIATGKVLIRSRSKTEEL